MKEDLLRRIADRLEPISHDVDHSDPVTSDFDLAPYPRPENRPARGAAGQGSLDDLRPASVLVPFVDRDHELTVLLTRRADHLTRHAGQVSFPGGRVDPEDRSPVHTALREAHEEVGLHPKLVSLLGISDTYETVTGFCVMPVLALVDGAFEPRPDPGEVAEVFEVPAAFLFDVANHERHNVEFQGKPRSFYAIPYENHYIWGATAAMIVALHRRLYIE